MGDLERTITMYKGESKPVAYEWFTDAAMTQPKDLTGATFRAAIKLTMTDEDYTIIKEDEAFDKTNAASGSVIFNLLKEDTLIAPYGEDLSCLLQVEATLEGGDIDKAYIDVLELKGSLFHD
jgi:hypothetical protein